MFPGSNLALVITYPETGKITLIADSLDLERFLQTEAGIEQKLQRRCELHKSTCNACELLSQQANIK